MEIERERERGGIWREEERMRGTWGSVPGNIWRLRSAGGWALSASLSCCFLSSQRVRTPNHPLSGTARHVSFNSWPGVSSASMLMLMMVNGNFSSLFYTVTRETRASHAPTNRDPQRPLLQLQQNWRETTCTDFSTARPKGFGPFCIRESRFLVEKSDRQARQCNVFDAVVLAVSGSVYIRSLRRGPGHRPSPWDRYMLYRQGL